MSILLIFLCANISLMHLIILLLLQLLALISDVNGAEVLLELAQVVMRWAREWDVLFKHLFWALAHHDLLLLDLFFRVQALIGGHVLIDVRLASECVARVYCLFKFNILRILMGRRVDLLLYCGDFPRKRQLILIGNFILPKRTVIMLFLILFIYLWLLLLPLMILHYILHCLFTLYITTATMRLCLLMMTL